ncbi:phenolic glucoside malonyltransferase 1-like [Cicer arietinum]|uniref:Phenolic glucoside malonyltransferase 1-like n=1 Tax=Cicer arietinum TaxID=3827 RepID=A0A1S2XHK5_CICAR|nr:phenolic glucoside malonyltransferase 1-like [Cicer arietinum]
MAQSSIISLKVHQVLSIAPKNETSPTTFPFTFFDTLWLRLPPVERLFFYENPNLSTTFFFESILPNLKNSLELTLQHFLLLVGNITWPQDSPHPTINYVPSDSISFIVAESNENFNHLCSNLCEVEKKQPFIPSLKISHEKASIIALQVTFFPNHGFCIGITTHHAAVDGKSSTLFMKSWSYFCSNLVKNTPSLTLPQNLTPFFDRSIINDPLGINESYSKVWLNFGGEINNRSLKVWETISAPKGEAIKGFFELSPLHIQKLKKYAQSKIEKNKVKLSTFSVTCAYLLSCTIKIENPNSNKVAFIFSVDCRPRLDPPINANYFGNCVLPQLVMAKTEAWLKDDGFISALEGIIDTLNGLENGVLNGAENWYSKMQSTMSETNGRMFSIAGSPRFEVYNFDFGWGKPKKVDVTSIDKTGAFSLSENKNNDGGIEIGLALNKQQMDHFVQHFSQGLESL